jgi:glycine/D-amino acid oxidase-like deaminating enzyme
LALTHIVIIGCGVVGATIAYELSRVPGLSITVLDQQPPAQAATGAALGVLIGILSQKVKGTAWRLRLESLERYETLIPELETLTGRTVPYNQQGLLKLCFSADAIPKWEQLAATRRTQGWDLHILSLDQLHRQYPQVAHSRLVAGVYSPRDRQVDPVALTLALVVGAQQRGVRFELDTLVQGFDDSADAELKTCLHIQTSQGAIATDWVIISAGLGSTTLTTAVNQPVKLQPVLGQALRVKLENDVQQLEPVIMGDDIHVVPLGQGEYWIGATVEFPVGTEPAIPGFQALEEVLQQAIAFYPALATAQIIKTWSGFRPRPEGRPAPIIGRLPGYRNVLLATGHYRNGVLLAPATALRIQELITS